MTTLYEAVQILKARRALRESVSKHGTHNQKDHGKRGAAAVYAAALTAEPQITSDLTALAAAQGLEMAGLDFRIKTLGSYNRKIAGKMKEGDYPDATSAAKSMIDVVRYTAICREGSYGKDANAYIKSMKDNGYKMTKVKEQLGA